jgi:zinc protease
LWDLDCDEIFSGEVVPVNQMIPVLQHQKYKLKNGLEVILREDHRLPLAAVNIWYHVGPANERPGLTGFAHLFEHMMFEGSKHVGEKAHFRYLEAAGATTINGTTDFDRTSYFETVPSNQLELALWLESDRMGFLLDKLNDRKFENQRDVVRNERRQNIESLPYGLVQEELFHQLFPKDHPYYASIIGSHADIEAARLEDVREFFRLYYAPNNACMAIVGDIDPEKTRDLVEKYFGPIPAGKPVPRTAVKTPAITSEKHIVVGDQVELPRVYLSWITDPIFTQADAECDLIGRILGGGKSSRLYESLVYNKRIAQDVNAQQYSLALGSIFGIEATGKPGVKPEELEKVIEEEIKKFLKKGPKEAELERARNSIESAILRGLENLGGFGGVADRLNQYNHFLGDPGFLSKDLERYYKATTDSLRSTARNYLKREARVVIYGIHGKKAVHDVPKSSGTASTPAAAQPQISGQDWRSTPPPPGPVPILTLPVPREFELANGFKAFLIEQHSLPIVSANVIVLSGSDQNPLDQPGLASFTAEMLDEGTAKRSPLDIAADADQIGASIATRSSMDWAMLSVRTLKKNVDAAFEIASDMLLNPSFAPHEIDRIRHDRLTQIIQQKDNPNLVALKVFFNALYGSVHPYGYLEVGSRESNEAITQKSLIGFYKKGYVPANAAFVVAGDITEQELHVLAEKYFGNWRGARTDHAVTVDAGKQKRRIVIVERPGASQTVLRIGHVGVSRATPDYIALEVMNTTLGELFSSRINLNLREKHGYTYNAFSSFVFRRGPGPFVVGTSVRTDVTAPAVVEIFHELDRMRETEVTGEELETAKESIARSLPGLFETTPQTSMSIGQMFVYGLPLTYYRDLPRQIEEITAAEVRRVAEVYLSPEESVVVAVGDRSKIESELEKLKLGPIEVLNADGNPSK